MNVCVASAGLVGGGAMTEFQEKLRQQHKESMHRELEALINTASDAEAEVRKSNAPKTNPHGKRLIWNEQDSSSTLQL